MADRVVFTRPDAARIANAVRKVEEGSRNEAPLRFGRVLEQVASGSRLTLGTFSGDWPVDSYKTVTIVGVTSTPNTASVLNLCVASLGADERYVIFGKARNFTAAYLAIEIEHAATGSCTLTFGGVDLTQIPGYELGDIQMLGHEAGDTASTCHGSLQWYSITTCATATSSP